MEDVILSIVPVGITSLVTGCLNDWFWWSNNLLMLWQILLSLLSFVVYFVSSGEVHSMRVDNLCFLLEIEGSLVIFNMGFLQFSVVVLPIVGEKCLRVWISDESISASRHSSSLIPGG